MLSDTEINDTREFLREHAPKSVFPPSPWRPRFTLGNFILFVVIIALAAAYIAKTNEIKGIQKEYAQQTQQKANFNHMVSMGLNFVAMIPSDANFGFVRVYPEKAFGTNRSQYALLVYLDPEKEYLLRFADQDIPLSGTPAAKTTYHIKAVGDQRDSRNFIRFQIDFAGEGYHYDDYEQPFEGVFVIRSYFARFGSPSAGSNDYDSGWLPQRMVSNPLKVEKDKKIKDWIYLLLEHGSQTGGFHEGKPLQLVRIRSNPHDPDPSPGVMLWLEELGDQPVPPDALPFQSRP